MRISPMEHITYSVPGKKVSVPIYISENSFDKIKSIIYFNKYSSVLVVIDENVSHHWSDRINSILGEDAMQLIIPAGERNKSISTVEKIWSTLSKKGFNRKSLVINIGGGMVCDIGAFAASTFMRGISFVQIPTTLLAQADAAIGGKTGFNFNGLKNTIGTFSAPVGIISDISFLSTLPEREYRSGFAEIIKHALISENNLFDNLLVTNPTSLKGKKRDEILLLSNKIKCAIVRKDPFEKNDRKKLNFGHTIGHAIEMACYNSPKQLLHGEAIAIGMLAEARMSVVLGHLSEKKFGKIEKLIVSSKLPDKISSSYKDSILKKILFDKKNDNDQVNWVFLKDIGKMEVDVSLPNNIVIEGLKYILE